MTDSTLQKDAQKKPKKSLKKDAQKDLPELPKAWSRATIIATQPEVDCNRYPVRRALGEAVQVTADIVTDGHDVLAAELLYWPEGGEQQGARMVFLGNDRYETTFHPGALGTWFYKVQAWVDPFATWQELFERRVKGGSPDWELTSELKEGAAILRRAAGGAKGDDKAQLSAFADAFEEKNLEAALTSEVAVLASRYDPREGAAEGETLELSVDRALARFGSWYEFFPRSSGQPGEFGTLDDAAKRLDYVKEMGFDIVYLPPIHPIGKTHRKGKDNAPEAEPHEPGSPWAVGNEDGGHKTVNPDLGGMEAFERFMARAGELGLEVALDVAFQCSPDHPYAKEHPEWFRQRPDGSIRYAENPPKKYQDIYPINFESDDWRGLWTELRSIFEFWAERGVRVFRVDNPHTKPLAFWEWCFRTLRETYPDLVFLAEAFTRPKLMYALGKVGFNQSYTYFTWRYTKAEFEEYLTELFHTDVHNYYRPNFWPNTPDILPPYLRDKPTFEARLILASTLSAAYGIYGPAFELMDNQPHPAREEYLNNEKYEVKVWDLGAPYSLKPLITRINEIRQQNGALHHNRNLRFHAVDNEQLMAYTKQEGDNLMLMVVNFDAQNTQSGFVDLPLHELGLSYDEPYVLEDLLDGARYLWQGGRNYLELNPHRMPAHMFRVSRHVRREEDFEGYV